jgi:hypothetical protein
MNKLVVATAFALAGFTVSAAACDWNREVSNGPTVVADCTGADCKNTETPPIGPTATQQQDSRSKSAVTQDLAKEESWPVFVADCGNSGCR